VYAISQLTHPNTIQIYDYGHTDDGTFFYSMEYLDGLDIEALVRIEGQVSPERMVYLLRQACLSLREAHGRQLVHRDIKPHNIMLCARGGEYDVVKLLDFGLVKDIAGETGRESSLTQVVAGTPAYMAPERLSAPLSVDGRADIFALGAVAYRMLTGADPFDGRILLYDTQNIDLNSTLPSRRSRYKIPPQLDELVQRCLASSADDRPATIQAMLDVLDSIEWSEPWTSAKAEQWWIDRGFALRD
jgi:serine/threonine protein kinase